MINCRGLRRHGTEHDANHLMDATERFFFVESATRAVRFVRTKMEIRGKGSCGRVGLVGDELGRGVRGGSG